MKFIVQFVLTVVFLCSAVIFSAMPVSCRMSEEGIKILGGDLSSPVLTSWAVTAADTLRLDFSERVLLDSVMIRKIPRDGGILPLFEKPSDAGGKGDAVLAEAVFSGDGKCLTVVAEKALDVGENYQLYGEISDEAGNTLSFSVPFVGYNSRIPRLAIVAVHPKYTSSKRAGETVYKNEFVELYAATGGNIGGVQVVSAADSEDKYFTLPSVEVEAGTFVTVHMRTRGDGCVSETAENMAACRQEYASDTSLDLWSPNTAACLGDSADVIMLRSVADGKILDAVAYAPSGNETWPTDALRAAAEQAVAAGVWNSSSPKDAACSDDLTPSKMIARTDGKSLAKGSVEPGNGKNWTVMPVVAGSGKNRASNLGKFVFN